MELRIDNLRCDLGKGKLRIPAYDVERMTDPSTCREGRSMEVVLPLTTQNSAIMCREEESRTDTRFNDSLHRAAVVADGVEIFSGTARLLEISDEGYKVEIRSGGAGWAAQAARGSLAELEVEYSAELTPTTVNQSWKDNSPVKFFPLLKDSYPPQINSTDLLPSVRLLSVDDYHPFLHVATLVERIFAKAGYTVESDFFTSDLFRSLYISGAYPTHDSAAAVERMGFEARRQSEATAEANHLGRVWCDPTALYNTLGNIVQTATPDSVNDLGEPMRNLYNNGGCFSTDDDGRIAFTPPTDVSTSFDYTLRYTTDHRILSRERLTAFDSFYLGNGTRITFRLANRYEDRRDKLGANHSYRAIVFDHTEGRRYRLTYTLNGTRNITWAEFDSRSTQVATPYATALDDPQLWYSDGEGWWLYTGDWALYDGHIEECGQTLVEVHLRTAPQNLAADTAHHFDGIFIEGAEPGMSITLHRETSLTPHFSSVPGLGSRISFADVARHSFSQGDLIEALAQMFSLRFYTSEELHKVWIEPEEEFFGRGAAADWSGAADLSEGILRRQTAPLHREMRTLAYRAADAPVVRFEKQSGSKFGNWSFSAGGYAAAMGEERISNKLFAPTLNIDNEFASAPSALVMKVGDRDNLLSGEEFTPRIVRFAGMHPLSDGELWSAPESTGEYPLAAFHFAGDDHMAAFTLCFEDRDSAEGLHRYHDRRMEMEAHGEEIELTLRLAPDLYAALFAPACGMAEIRSHFTIDTGDGAIVATLAKAGEYDPEKEILRCTFKRIN